MEVMLPPEVSPEAILAFSPIAIIPIIAGVVQVFIKSGLPLRHASLLALVIGVGLGVSIAATTNVVLVIGIIQGAAAGLGAAGLWLNLSHHIDTNGD